MFTARKPLLPAWQTGRGRGPAGGRSRFIDGAERPGEIKVKGSSLAEARPLFINQRGLGQGEKMPRLLGGRRLPSQPPPLPGP